MSLLIDIVDETGSVSEEMLKEVENLLQFAAEREGVQDQAEVSVTIVSNDDIQQFLLLSKHLLFFLFRHMVIS